MGRKEDGKRNGWMRCSWIVDDRHPGPKTTLNSDLTGLFSHLLSGQLLSSVLHNLMTYKVFEILSSNLPSSTLIAIF